MFPITMISYSDVNYSTIFGKIIVTIVMNQKTSNLFYFEELKKFLLD